MKKILSFFLCAMLMLCACVSALADGGAQPQIETYSDAYVVIDAATGQVLLQKNMHKREYPASITKIMTMLLGLESSELSDIVTMTDEAVYSVDYNSSHIALSSGEMITMEQLLYATQLASANDAANGIAAYIGGSLDSFASMMNKKAKEVGALDTHFVNANGLEDKNHYTTAYDMAMITKYALTVPYFRTLFGSYEYTIPPTNIQPEARNIGTAHHMIVTSAYQYDGAWGGKLGWTNQAQHTAVTVAKRGDMELICVVMRSANKWYKYKDTKKLFDYCFKNFAPVTVTTGALNKVIPISQAKSVVGVARVYGESSYTMLLNKAVYSENDVKTEVSIKPRYELGEQVEPTVTFYVESGDENSENDLLTLPLNCKVELDSDTAQGSQDIVENKNDQASFSDYKLTVVEKICLVIAGLVALAAVLFVLFLILRLFVQLFFKIKRQRAYKGFKRTYD